jgi:hypothetical protein
MDRNRADIRVELKCASRGNVRLRLPDISISKEDAAREVVLLNPIEIEDVYRSDA